MTEIINNYEMKKESTFKIGGRVIKAAFPSCIEDLVELLKTKEYDCVLGNCSNVLFTSSDINKSLIITKNINGYKTEGNRITVSAGTLGSVMARECLKNSLSGFEFLIGFPGTFGGMIYMNASAHNQAVSDYFVSAKIFDTNDNKIKILSKKEMDFKYRYSSLSKTGAILLEAEFELPKGDAEKIEETMNRNIEFRKTRQPSLKWGNIGSIFKNPENDSAGRLLDLCEMKGQKEGGAMVFENHANFIINYDNATSMDVIMLMYKMYSKVREKYTIEIKPEIKYIGNTGTEEYKIWSIMNSENMQTM